MSQFLIDNSLLIVVIAVSVLGLLIPVINTRRYAPEVSPAQATELINRQGAQIVDVRKAADFAKGHIANSRNIPADQIQVLSPTRKYLAGTANLNAALQAALNPPRPERGEKKHGSFTFRVGDRVMQIKNNYDVLWRAENSLQGGTGVFNGDIGLITDITPEGDVTTVNFDGHVVEYTPDMLNELEPAYAMTVHKSQGSEYRAVILAVCEGAPMLLTRGVLYTAITRARELLILVGDDVSLGKMAANDRRTRRYSGLRWRLGNGGTA